MTNEIKYHQIVDILNYGELAEAVRKCLSGHFCSVDIIVTQGESDKILLTAAEKNKLKESTFITLKFNKDAVLMFAHSCLTKTELENIIKGHI